MIIQSRIKLAQNPKFHEQSKQIAIRFHFLCEQVEKNTIQLIYCNTTYMIAYFLTKSLLWPKHEFCVIHSGLHYIEDIC
jgi:hypothetical protein